jgi:hypothetical protein
MADQLDGHSAQIAAVALKNGPVTSPPTYKGRGLAGEAYSGVRENIPGAQPGPMQPSASPPELGGRAATSLDITRPPERGIQINYGPYTPASPTNPIGLGRTTLRSAQRLPGDRPAPNAEPWVDLTPRSAAGARERLAVLRSELAAQGGDPNSLVAVQHPGQKFMGQRPGQTGPRQPAFAIKSLDRPTPAVNPAGPAEAGAVKRGWEASNLTLPEPLPGYPMVEQAIERLRGVNTPAAQSFVRDYDAGRIGREDVLRRAVYENLFNDQGSKQPLTLGQQTAPPQTMRDLGTSIGAVPPLRPGPVQRENIPTQAESQLTAALPAETLTQRLQTLADQRVVFEHGEEGAAALKLARSTLKFSSGLSSIADLTSGAFGAAHNQTRGVGVTAAHISRDGVDTLAHAIVNFNTPAFVDSGAFGSYIATIKALNAGKPPPKPINFNEVFARYHQIMAAIHAAARDDSHYYQGGQLGDYTDTPGQDDVALKEGYPMPLLVMPDKVGDQAGSLALLQQFKDDILDLQDSGAQIIVPVQKGQLSMAQAYEQAAKILGNKNFIVGIPSNAEAVSPSELEDFLREARPRAIHVLGAAANSTLTPRIKSVLRANPDTVVTADASPILSQVIPAVREGVPRPDAVANSVAEQPPPSRTPDEVTYNFFAGTGATRKLTKLVKRKGPGHTDANPNWQYSDSTGNFITPKEAKLIIQGWKDAAAAEGRKPSKERPWGGQTVLSLFDASGEWAKPWDDAGYNVITMDLQSGQDLADFDAETFTADWGIYDVYAVLAAPPCTTFTNTARQHWHKQDAPQIGPDGEEGPSRTDLAVHLVQQVLRTVDLFTPTIWALENPEDGGSRLAKLTNLPPASVTFDPYLYGDPYTKKTGLWGSFNSNMPEARVPPTEGSKVYNLPGSAKYERSLTPEEFAYSFFMANHWGFMDPAERLARTFKGMQVGQMRELLANGWTDEALHSALQDMFDGEHQGTDPDTAEAIFDELMGQAPGQSAPLSKAGPEAEPGEPAMPWQWRNDQPASQRTDAERNASLEHQAARMLDMLHAGKITEDGLRKWAVAKGLFDAQMQAAGVDVQQALQGYAQPLTGGETTPPVANSADGRGDTPTLTHEVGMSWASQSSQGNRWLRRPLPQVTPPAATVPPAAAPAPAPGAAPAPPASTGTFTMQAQLASNRHNAELEAAVQAGIKNGKAKGIKGVLAILAKSNNPVIAYIGATLGRGIHPDYKIVRWDETSPHIYGIHSRLPSAKVRFQPRNPSRGWDGHEDSEYVVTHELVHALTVNNYHKPQTKAQRQAKQELQDLARAAAQALHGEIDPQTGGRWYGTDDSNGLDTLCKEFMAEALTNSFFQERLSQIPYGDETLWTKFVKAVAKILGLDKPSMLTEALRLTEALSSTPEQPAEKTNVRLSARKNRAVEVPSEYSGSGETTQNDQSRAALGGGLRAQRGNDQQGSGAAAEAADPRTNTPAFRAWFGNSKVVDAQGQPLVVYHGSYRDFDTFNRDASLGWRQPSMDTVGSWFSTEPGPDGKNGAGMYAAGEGAITYPVYLSIQKPKTFKTFNDFLNAMHKAAGRDPRKQNPPGRGTARELREQLQAQGFDGIRFERTSNQSLFDEIDQLQRDLKNERDWEYKAELEREIKSLRKVLDKWGSSTEFDGQDVWIAFEPTQVKSAIGNSGAFSPTDPSMVASPQAGYSPDSGEAAPTWAGFPTRAEYEAHLARDAAHSERMRQAWLRNTPGYTGKNGLETNRQNRPSDGSGVVGENPAPGYAVRGDESGSALRDSSPGRRVTGLGIAQDIQRTGHAALVGREVSGPQALAELAQVYRDPRYETFRVFYVKGNTIVHATGVSARQVGRTGMYPSGMSEAEYHQSMRDTMAATGADGYYLLHNHPSGDPTPSGTDTEQTQLLGDAVPGMLGHVIVNSNKWALIRNGVLPGASQEASTNVHYFGPEQLLRVSRPHPILGRALGSADDLAVAGKSLQQPGFITLIAADGANRVRGVIEVPSSVLQRSDKYLMALVRRYSRLSGSTRMFAVGSDGDIAQRSIVEAVRSGILADALPESGRTLRDRVQPGKQADIGGPTRELREASADPMGNNYKALEGRTVSMPVQIEDTGQTATMTTDAAKALRDYDSRIQALQRLLACLA